MVRGDLVGAGVHIRRGIPTTDPARAILDTAGIVSPSAAALIVDRSISTKLITVPGLIAVLDRYGRRGRRGVGTLRRLLDDPFLSNVAAVVFDEFHERSLASDLALAMVRQIQQRVRPDLKIVVMSATLAVEPIAQYLGGCPTVESRGRMFPVAVQYLPHLERRPLVDQVAEGITSFLDLTGGDCLVFRDARRIFSTALREGGATFYCGSKRNL